MKIELEIPEALHKQIVNAAKNLKLPKKKFMVRTIRQMARANQEDPEDVAASIKRFFEENPNCRGGWWEDRGWEDYWK